MIITPTFTDNFSQLFGPEAAAAKTAWINAAAVFTSYFSDSIHINITVDATADPNVFSSSVCNFLSFSYADVLTKVTAHARTFNDVIAIGPEGSMTAADPTNGTGTWFLSRAQAKALGLIPDDTSEDGKTIFGTEQNWSFTLPIGANTYDFEGAAAHEISEAMGRTGLSGKPFANAANAFSLIDNFSYTGAGTKGLGGGPGEYFSIDNGITLLKLFNDPTVNHLDSRDWAPGTDDSFDQFSPEGEANPVSVIDLQLMDVIGYDLRLPLALGRSSRYVSGDSNAVALDDHGHVVSVLTDNHLLYYLVGTVDFGSQTIAWGEGIQYDSGGPNAVALDDHGHAVEVHVGTNRLFYRVGDVDLGSQAIEWGTSIQYDTGGPNAIALDDHGHVVEVHVDNHLLYYRVGTVDFGSRTITWGPSIQYDTGGPNAVALDDHGHVVEVHVGTHRLYYRVGTVDFIKQMIAWGPSIQYDTGGPNAIALDDHGSVVEVHVGSGRLLYKVGTVDFISQTITGGQSIQYDTGGPNAIAVDDHGNLVEVHVGSGRLYSHVGFGG